MIDLQNVSKSYGPHDVLVNVSFRINSGEHTGVVGPNGSGKSTVAAIIAGDIAPDKGSVTIPKDSTVGYLKQQVPASHSRTPLLRFAESGTVALAEIEAEMELIEDRLRDSDVAGRQRTSMLDELGRLQIAFEQKGGYGLRHRAESSLSGLGFRAADFNRPLEEFSGGWQMRAALARCLTGNPGILLLDEPSNYLDLPAVEWLQRFLREFKGTMVLVSHERYLLNSLTSVTIEIANGQGERYAGNYDYYRKEREKRYASSLAARQNRQRKVEKAERFVERFRAKASKASQVRSRIKMIERMDSVEIPPPASRRGSIHIPLPPRCGQEIVRLEDVSLTYDGQHWVLRNLSLRIERGDKLALVGHNGMGKTTLLRLLAGLLRPCGGRRITGKNVVRGYQAQEFSENMDPGLTVYETLKSVAPESREQEGRNLLGAFGFSGQAVDNKVAVLSGGEKVRLAFARLLIKPPNFLLLDEPTTHLDIQAREMLERALIQYQGTICMVSHDVAFVEKIATGVVVMESNGIDRFYGTYAEYRRRKEADSADGIHNFDKNQKFKGVFGQDDRDRKQRRRQRAAERQAESGRIRELKKAIVQSEREIENLEREQERLLELLANPDKNSDFAATNLRLQRIQAEIAAHSQCWLQAGEELEKISA